MASVDPEAFQAIIDKYLALVEEKVGTKCVCERSPGTYITTIHEGQYRIAIPTVTGLGYNTTVGIFSIMQLPGCCGICLSYHAQTSRFYKNKGIGTILNKMRIEMAKELGYGIMMCTDIKGNEPQEKILTKNGWKSIFSFNNPRTSNNVNIHTINL